jgi:arylsulfatase A-like enzyme
MNSRLKAMHNRRQFLASAGAALATGMCAGARSAHAGLDSRPNIVVLVTDDQRWDSLSCMGTPVVQTPNLDRLAAEGVLFENNFCTTSICMSSRATILTGLHTRCHGINDFRQPPSDALYERTYPVRLRAAGYRTGFVGKWGLGGPLPEDRFDFFDGFSGQGKYFHEIEGDTRHLTNLIGDKAGEFLAGCAENQPFCLSVSFKAPHVQDQDPRQYLYDPAFEELFQADTVPVPKTADPAFFDTLPEFIRTSEGRKRWKVRFPDAEKFQESVKGYYRLIYGVDAVVGRIRDALDRQKLADNTVILFTSDNGIFLGERGLAGKWLMHEESIRVPLIVHDPRLPTGNGGRRTQMTLLNDVAPTIFDLGGLEVPGDVQGRSLVPMLGDPSLAGRTEWFYEHTFEHPRIPKSEGIRTERWKYIRYTEVDPLFEELYDLTTDPHEERNLAGRPESAATLDRLRARWEHARAALVRDTTVEYNPSA